MKELSMKIIFIAIFLAVFSCKNNQANQILINPDVCVNFDLKQGFIKINATIFDSLHGVFALDNGKGVTTIDSAFFYAKFDTSKFVLKYKRFDGVRFYKGNVQITIANYTFLIKEIWVSNLSKKVGVSNINGIIGVEPFLDKKVHIDFEKQIISFSDSITIDSQYINIPMYPALDETNEKAYSNMKFLKIIGYGIKPGEKINGHLQFDLGCQETDMLVKEKFIKLLKANKIKQGKCDLYEGLQKAEAEAYMLDSIKIGNINFNNIIISSTFFKPKNEPRYDMLTMFSGGDGYLGVSLLKKTSLITDYKNNILYIKQNKNFDDKKQAE